MSRQDKGDLPPPVTAKSSARALWQELKAANAEIDQQQVSINALRTSHDRLGMALQAMQDQRDQLQWQLGLIKAVLEGPQ